MRTRYPICHFSAILVSVSYLSFAVLARVLYPSRFSPSSNWLSDLGNRSVNVPGARFYNTGIIVTALFLIVWFLGLSQWRVQGSAPQKWLLRVAMVAGTLGCLSLALSALYPIDMFAEHAFWSHAHFMMLAMGFGFSVASLRYHPRFPRKFLYLGTAAAMSPLFVLVLDRIFFLEWLAVGLFLAYVLSVGFSTKELLRGGVSLSPHAAM